MTEAPSAFKFEHVPHNIDKSSIKVLVNTKGIYSLDYGIVQPQDVFINMRTSFRNWEVSLSWILPL